jgi:hypothetical protein
LLIKRKAADLLNGAKVLSVMWRNRVDKKVVESR